MRRAVAVVGMVGMIGGGLSLAIVPTSRTEASPKAERTFLIPAGDGYGVADCISSQSECGKIVATAWCESQGYVSAVSYGLAAKDDFTGTTVARPAAATSDEQPLAITCAD